MITFDPKQLAEWTRGHWTVTPVSLFTGFTMDSRQLRTGQVFIALRTAQQDGHNFLPAALAAGASAAIVSRVNPELNLPQLLVPDPLVAFQAIARRHRQAFRGRVIGISGSVGKTSTKNLLALLLGGEAGGVLATEGNLNNHLGVPLTLTKLDHELHKFAVVEAGISGPGEMAPLALMIEPDLAIITLVSPAHVEALGTIEGVAKEKSVLPRAVKAGGVAVFPKQCEAFESFAELEVDRMVVERADVIRPEAPPKGRVEYTITHREGATAVALAYGQPPPLIFTLRRVSDGMAQNAVLAISAALRLGVTRTEIQARLGEWRAAAMRGELREEAGKLLYVDCYNANPASMADALDAFYGMAPANQPRLFVLGGMEELGAESAMFHRALGRSLRLRAEDHVFAIGDHAEALREGALAAGVAADQIEAVTSLEPMRARLADFAGAVFLKGSRRYQLESLLDPAVNPHAHA